MAENLEMWIAQVRPGPTGALELGPREYLERNFRLSPFWWEPVDKYIDRFGLESVYCYASDYPHFEGGVDPISGFAARMERHGADASKKFFVTNAELLLP